MITMAKTLLAAGLAAALYSTSAQAAVYVPAGLAPGEAYQLAFLSSAGTVATSGDISYYNAFVQALADAAGIGVSEGVSWAAIASTADVDANANAVVSARVFNMNGELVASGFADFWDGSHTVGVGIDYEEDGTGRSANVWTGSTTNGTEAVGFALGNERAIWGESVFASAGWIYHATQLTTTSYRLYALSEVLFAPIPVPAAGWLFGSGLLGLIGISRRRQTV